MIERADAVNWSTAKHLLRSPKHYRHALENPRPDTEALLRGRALHCAVYEPHAWFERYVVMPRFHGGMKDETAREKGYEGGKEAKAEWERKHLGKAEILTAEMYAAVEGMNAALKRDPLASAMIVGGFAEQLITWTDPITGIECRGRVDHVDGTLSDLKSTRSLQWFERDVVRLCYHAQLAFYADGLAANGIILNEQPCLIAVESEAPHDVLVLEFTDDDLAEGRKVYRYALDLLAECRAKNEWHGVGRGMKQRVRLPSIELPGDDEHTLTFEGEAAFA